MALRHDPTASSLEDELAEATRDLLDLGGGGGPSTQLPQQRNRFLKAALLNDAPLPTPSPLLLNPSEVTRVDKAFAIDANARLTPIDDGDASQPAARRRPTAIVINDSNADAATLAQTDSSPPADAQHAHVRAPSDEHFPAAHLHRTVRSVVSSAGLLYEPQRSGGGVQTASPSLLAAQQQLQSQQWLDARGERVLDSKVEQRMSGLQKRLMQARSASASTEVSKGAEDEAEDDRTPAFFRESFPDTQATDVVGEPSSSTSVATSRQPPETASPPPTHASMPLHLKTPLAAAAESVHADVVVKLHGNRRAEREAALLADDDDEMDDAPVGDETLISLDPSRSTDDDVGGGGDDTSLLSLPATTATSSSHASSSSAAARRRPHPRRRRSIGSQSHRSLDGDGATTAAPFARDVSIRSFSVVGEKARGYVAYDVRITTRNGTTIGVLRRFSSFVALRKALLSECGSGDKSLPPLPARRTGLLHKYAAHHLEKRRRALQSWLAHVMLDATWGSSNALRQWVVGNDDEV